MEKPNAAAITAIGRIECQIIGTKAEQALREAFAQFNLEVKRGNATYDLSGGYCEIRFQFNLRKADGTVETKEAADFKRAAFLYGLKPEDLGRTFTLGRQTFTLCGLKTKSQKYPILGRAADGKVFKFSHRDVARQLHPDHQPAPAEAKVFG